jgi:hypothetical protein
MTDGAGRWVCEQVGGLGRTLAEVAREQGCDWHTVNHGEATPVAIVITSRCWSNVRGRRSGELTVDPTPKSGA